MLATYVLDTRGRAWDEWESGSLRGLFGEVTVLSASGIAPFHDVIHTAGAVVVTLSASGAPNIELDAVRLAKRFGTPTYGIEEVLGGRNNPGWTEPISLLRRLFTSLRTDEDDTLPVTVVGPPQLERYRGVDVGALGAEARRKLGIPPHAPLVFYSGHPEPENPHVLSRVGEALAIIRKRDIAGLVLVVARHGRELAYPVADNAAAHRHALRLIRERVGIMVIENSVDYRDLPGGHPEAIPAEFRPKEFATFQELVCACMELGVVVTGFGTDGMIIAPPLGIPSVLYLDDRNYLFGGLLAREKRMQRLPLPVVPQVKTVEKLAETLAAFFDQTWDARSRRAEHCARLRAAYPFPTKSPAERIADIVCEELGHTPC